MKKKYEGSARADEKEEQAGKVEHKHIALEITLFVALSVIFSGFQLCCWD